MIRLFSRSLRATRRPSTARTYLHALESLEPRTLLSVTIPLNGKTATYTDFDGDKVTLAVSLGTLTGANFTTIPTGLGDQLTTLDFSAGGFDGANLTFTVVQTGTGDGFANVGIINSTGHDLGNVTLKGDLGRIDAGDAIAATPAIKLLSVRSMGHFGLLPQGATTGSLVSTIQGALTAWTVAGDVDQATMHVLGDVTSITIGGSLLGGNASSNGAILISGNARTIKIAGNIQGGAGNSTGFLTVGGTLSTLTIAGSIIGGAASNTGNVTVGGNIDALSIGHDLMGGNGSGTSIGFVKCFGRLANVTIGGSIVGGGPGGPASGGIFATQGLGNIKIAGDLQGGAGVSSGFISTNLGINNIAIGGSLIGGVGDQSGFIFSNTTLNSLTIGSNLAGGAGLNSGEINVQQRVGSIRIGGSFLGGSGNGSGFISSNSSIGTLTIAHDVAGSTGFESASLFVGAIEKLTIGGSLIGSAFSSALLQVTDLGSLTVGGNIRGGPGQLSGGVTAFDSIASISIGGSVLGGSGANSAQISVDSRIGAIKIAGDLRGGSAPSSGVIRGGASLASISIGASIVGGGSTNTGCILITGNIGSILIAHDLLGGSVAGALSLDHSGYIESSTGRIASLTVGGSIISGTNTGSGTLTTSASVRAAQDIGSITVNGSIIGNPTLPVIISAHGTALPTKTDLAIGALSVRGRVEYANFLAGYTTSLAADNGSAQIGPVKVGGDWIASNLIAGADNQASTNLRFGDANDAPILTLHPAILSTITSITIAGNLVGTPDAASPTDHFGFVAQKIGALKAHGLTFTLSPLNNTDDLALGLTGDFNLHEV